MSENKTKKTKEKMKKNLISVSLLGIVVVLSFVIHFGPSFGWYSDNRLTNGSGANMHVVEMVLPTIHAWRFDMEGGESSDSLDKTGSWVEGMNTITSDSYDFVEISENDQQGEKYQILSLHLGTVDNLLMLNEDNCFYIRVDISEETITTMGKAVSASYSIVDMKFFDSVGSDATDDIRNNYSSSYNALLNLVDVDCSISLDERSMTTGSDAAAIEGFFSTKVINSSATADSNNYVQLNHNGTPTPIFTYSENDSSSGGYYLYIRLRPDLDTCFEATYDISTYMPCQLVFDISLELSFSNPTT